MRRGDFKMGILFILLSLGSAIAGFLAESLAGKVLAFSSAFAFLGIAAAYALARPELIGKKRAGRLLASSYLLFWPFHLLNFASLTLFRWSRQSEPFTE